MLAERKQKVKWSEDPQNTQWTKDKSKFGYKMLQKMGWSEGKGLGVMEDGALEHVKVKSKHDTSGLGVKRGRDDDWIAGQEEFNDLLANLNSAAASSTSDSLETSCHIKGIVPHSLKRHSYKKTIGSKDLSSKSGKDIDCVLGKRQKLTTCKDSLYALMMVDPDAPNPDYPYNKCWLHWIIGNINGSGLRNGDLSTGETVVAYNPPTPPKGSGPHRYFLFLLEQPYDKTVFNHLSHQDRPHFNPDKFIEQYNFSPAIGTSYFVTEDPK